MKKRLSQILLVVITLILGAGIGYIISANGSSPVVGQNTPQNPNEQNQTSAMAVTTSTPYPLLDGAVAFNNTQHFIINFEPLRTQLTTIQKQYTQSTYIYFVYLNNSATIGINNLTLFTAASTIKVPLAMAIYKMAEEGKLKMTDNYTLEEANLDSRFGDLYNVGPDNSFTINELVTIMLEKSDDTAMNALFTILQRIGINDPLADVYASMGWDEPAAFGAVPTYININTRTLSNMFSALYEATYDNADDSQQILSYLSQTPFNNDIAGGTPSAITVAHKIGVAAPNNTFSDCGIVYAPDRPYILCLGSSGASEPIADQFMSQISKTVYQYVINN